jgi:hypothetical protein
MTGKNNPEEEVREPVLSPVDRVSELLFGLLMALTFVGAVSVAEAGSAQIREMAVRAGDLGSRHDRRLLVQPEVE